ncbi:MAG: aminotransferase class I/II-fold pyridoxal phosphate-dependent enzyme, partial [Solirubrobacterales bacterium]|nr:aminotransferase class I/II-fold pyridoxal phosphate-dependent enzyme [Solirubrobacterales bacterium]
MSDWLAAAAAEREAVRYADPARSADGLLDLASNDYLGLARDPRVLAAAGAALDHYGASARASRVVTGTMPVHEWLEAELCTLTRRPSALAFSSGYTANLAVLTALGDPDTLIVSDAHVHASLIDGARLSRSPVQVFPHSDLDALESVLARRAQSRAIVVIESIYSVLGDAADVGACAELCERFDALLLIDEAHGIGVAGGGRGAAAGLENVVVTATLSKALGSQGGAVLGPPQLR